MSDNFKIESARNSDIQHIVELVRQTLQEFDLTFDSESSESDLVDIENTYLDNGGAFEIIRNEGGKIIATVALWKVNERTAKLRKMYVHKDYRRLGLGKALLIHIIDKARLLKFDTIILETTHRMKAAMTLYEMYGFEQTCSITAESPRCDIVFRKNLL